MANEEKIEKLKERVPLHVVVERYSTVRKEGGWWIANCPHPDHLDRSPDFKWKDGDRNACCFSHSGRAGASDSTGQWNPDIFGILMAAESIDFPDAVRMVEGMAGKMPDNREWDKETTQVSKTFKEPVKAAGDGKVFTLDHWCRTFAHKLAHIKAADEYVRSRGISIQTARDFFLGAAPDGHQLCGPDDPHYDHPWVGIPYVKGDKVLEVKWRCICSADRRTRGYRVMSGMNPGMYNLSRRKPDELGEIILVSGEFDCIVLEQAGFCAASIFSDSKPPEKEEREMLVRWGKIHYGADNDVSCRRTMNNIGVHLKRGLVFDWSPYKDANDCWLGIGRNAQAFQEFVQAKQAEAKEPMPPGFMEMSEAMSTLSSSENVQDLPERFRFPWKSIDDMLIVLPGHVVTLSSSITGTGKSTFMENAMIHNACLEGNLKKTPAIYAAEQSPDELARMAVAYLTMTDKFHLTTREVAAAQRAMANSRLFLGYDPTKTKVKEVVKLCEVAVRHLGITDLVIDNMGFVGRNEAPGRVYEAQANAMQSLKNLAKELMIRVWVICAVTKGGGGDKYAPKEMSDIFGSQAFEADADHVLMLHRDIIKNQNLDSRDSMSSLTIVSRKKSRSPGPGFARAALVMLGAQARFVDPEFVRSSPVLSDRYRGELQRYDSLRGEE